MPVNGSITLHCEAQGPDYYNYTSLQWNIAIGAYSWTRADISTISRSPFNRFSKLSNVNNPSILRVHNLLQSENGSTVQCLVANLPDTWSQLVTIYVEGKNICNVPSEFQSIIM